MIPALFFAFQFENPWRLLKFCCLKWPPGLYQFSDFISCSHADSTENEGKTLSPPWWSISWYFLPQGRQRALQGLLDWCFDHIAISVDETLFCFQWIFGENWIHAERANMAPSILKKKVSSNFIMLENSVPSTVCSPAVIMLSPRLRRIMQINVKKGGRNVILSVIDFNNNQYN